MTHQAPTTIEMDIYRSEVFVLVCGYAIERQTASANTAVKIARSLGLRSVAVSDYTNGLPVKSSLLV